jgi:hypothetical protein
MLDSSAVRGAMSVDIANAVGAAVTFGTGWAHRPEAPAAPEKIADVDRASRRPSFPHIEPSLSWW